MEDTTLYEVDVKVFVRAADRIAVRKIVSQSLNSWSVPHHAFGAINEVPSESEIARNAGIDSISG